MLFIFLHDHIVWIFVWCSLWHQSVCINVWVTQDVRVEVSLTCCLCFSSSALDGEFVDFQLLRQWDWRHNLLHVLFGRFLWIVPQGFESSWDIGNDDVVDSLSSSAQHMHQHGSEPPLQQHPGCWVNIQAAAFFGVRGFQACQLMSSSAVIHRRNSDTLPQQSNASAGPTIRRWARAQGSFLEIKSNPRCSCKSFKMPPPLWINNVFYRGVKDQSSRQAGGLSDRLIKVVILQCGDAWESLMEMSAWCWTRVWSSSASTLQGFLFPFSYRDRVVGKKRCGFTVKGSSAGSHTWNGLEDPQSSRSWC